MNGLMAEMSKAILEHNAKAERQEIRKLKAKIEIAQVELEELEEALARTERSLASREKQLQEVA